MRFVGFIIVLIIFGCNKPGHQNNEIIKVELARSGAWLDDGATISIDTSFTYKYFGDYGHVKQGYFIGKVDDKFGDSLSQKLENIKFKTLPVSDNAGAVDINYFQLLVHWKNGKRQLSRAWKWRADTVLNAIKWLDISYKKVRLHEVKGPFQFETTYHELPKPPIKQVKFPPPVLKK